MQAKAVHEFSIFFKKKKERFGTSGFKYFALNVDRLKDSENYWVMKKSGKALVERMQAKYKAKRSDEVGGDWGGDG